jgi:8-oxo-dGTP pyrophosphatase MutT (NUDIX family)
MIRASGCIFLAANTGRVMLQQRSSTCSYPNTWAFFGGKAELGERPIQTLLRELEEEIGALPSIQKVYPLYKFTSADSKFVYDTFLISVFQEFIPTLNNESSGFCWVDLNRLPHPLHPGVKAQVSNRELMSKIKTIHAFEYMDGPNWLDTLTD